MNSMQNEQKTERRLGLLALFWIVFVELVLPEAGTYPFVSHVMSDAEKGAHGLLRVSDAP